MQGDIPLSVEFLEGKLTFEGESTKFCFVLRMNALIYSLIYLKCLLNTFEE